MSRKLPLPPSPSWGGTDGEAVRAAQGRATAACALSWKSPTLDASRPVPPHEGEGGRALQPVRLGLRQITGLKEDEGRRLVAARRAGAQTLRDLAAHAGLSRRALDLIAEADALRSLGMDRRAGLWAVKGLAPEVKVESEAPLLALMGAPREGAVDLPAMALPAHVAEDYRTAGLSLKAHPCAFFRPLLASLGAAPAEALKTMKDGRRVAVGGLVLVRQRPGTAKGVVFVTLEDETGPANAVVWRDIFVPNRRVVMGSGFLVVHGRLQRAGEVIHVVAERFTDLTSRLADLKRESADRVGRLVRSRDFH
jgi:error-prone DNA polymerase